MSEPYTSPEAQLLGNVVSLLAASATFQDAVGATSATTARNYIIEGDGGLPSESGRDRATAVSGAPLVMSRATWGLVVVLGVEDDDTQAAGWSSRSAEILVGLHLFPPSTIQVHERLRYALNVVGGIRQDLIAAMYAGTGPQRCAIDVAVDPMPDQTSADAGALRAHLAIRFHHP